MYSASEFSDFRNERDPPPVRSVPRFGSTRRRATLHSSNLLQIEDCYIPPDGPFPDGFEHRVQVALIYHGIFTYAVGTRNWTVDANQTLFISPGWEANENHPLSQLGHAGVLLSPSLELLDEIAGAGGLSRNLAFSRGTLPSSMRLKLLTQHVLKQPDQSDPLWFDEWAVECLRESIQGSRRRDWTSSRVVERAKALLQARSGERLSLESIARAVGVTPVYLTQEFSRVEGVPLYRYQLRLRLTRALVELPHCNDITGLALDLGFSSHSHFSATFRNAFGVTPNHYRANVGSRSLDIQRGSQPRFNPRQPCRVGSLM